MFQQHNLIVKTQWHNANKKGEEETKLKTGEKRKPKK
jgi:hypothetical protein